MKHSGHYRDRLVQRFRDLLDAHGSSVAKVEKSLQRGRGYIADALRGDKKLSIETLIEGLDSLGVPPEQFFERPPIPSGIWRSEIAETEAVWDVESLPASIRDASPLVQALALLLVQKGLMKIEEIVELQRKLSSGER